MLEHSVHAQTHPIVGFIRLKMNIRSAAFDRIDKHLVDDAHNRRIVYTGGINPAAALVFANACRSLGSTGRALLDAGVRRWRQRQAAGERAVDQSLAGARVRRTQNSLPSGSASTTQD